MNTLDLKQVAAFLKMLYDLREMGGWKFATMVRRYANLALAQLARQAAVVSGLLAGLGQPQGGLHTEAVGPDARQSAAMRHE